MKNKEREAESGGGGAGEGEQEEVEYIGRDSSGAECRWSVHVGGWLVGMEVEVKSGEHVRDERGGARVEGGGGWEWAGLNSRVF